MASTWSSVMSWPAMPANQITLEAPKAAHSALSTWAWDLPGLRLELRMLLRVAIRVPAPSASTAPPSATSPAAVNGRPR